MSTKARQFLEHKLRETIAECGVPALAAAMVRNGGATMVSAQQGVRKLGASGAGNAIQESDKFNLGSVSKVITGNLMGKLIQDGVGGLQWNTRLGDVLPELWVVPQARDGYKNVTLEQLLTHTSGMPYQPESDKVNDWKTYTPLDMNKTALKKRRVQYTLAALLDAPSYWPPGSNSVYGGGGIIASCMAEKKTGQTYEDLVKQHLFTPLGMTNSGFGRMSPGALNGPWQHSFSAEDFSASPDNDTHLPGYSWGCRTPVGGVCSSAGDLAKFMREQLRADPQVFTIATRSTMQTHVVSPHSNAMRGAWISDEPGSATTTISHNGDNGVSYAHMTLRLGQGVGYVAMSNMSSTISKPAVDEMHEVMAAMQEHWTMLFGPGSFELIEGVHAMPAITQSGPNMMLFGRRHDGRVLRRRSTNGGASWQDAGDFGPVIVNSGLGAAVSGDGTKLFVVGRGLDNKAWIGWSTNGGTSWQGWTPIGAGVFLTGAAIACSASGGVVHVVGIGTDRRMWRARSQDGGQSWSGWSPIGQGVFTSGPAIATSADGSVVHVAARGTDWRLWRNESVTSGTAFMEHWQPVGKGLFSSGPGLATSDDGKRVHLMARGTDRRLWRNSSPNGGDSWHTHWQAVPDGTFTSAPSIATDSSGMVLDAYAYGGDFRVWGTRSTDGGQSWGGWSQKGPQVYL